MLGCDEGFEGIKGKGRRSVCPLILEIKGGDGIVCRGLPLHSIRGRKTTWNACQTEGLKSLSRHARKEKKESFAQANGVSDLR